MFNENIYLQLSEYAKNFDHSKFLNEISKYFGYLYDKNDMDDIALKLQIINKGKSGSKPLYLHSTIPFVLISL